MQILQAFIADAIVIELKQPIKIQTAQLRKAHKIKLPDAIIAATAMAYNLTLLTRNTADFKTIESLLVLNPWEQ